jgi:hypothetical protein
MCPLPLPVLADDIEGAIARELRSRILVPRRGEGGRGRRMWCGRYSALRGARLPE